VTFEVLAETALIIRGVAFRIRRESVHMQEQMQSIADDRTHPANTTAKRIDAESWFGSLRLVGWVPSKIGVDIHVALRAPDEVGRLEGA